MEGTAVYLTHGSIDPDRIPVVFEMALGDYGKQPMLPGDVIRTNGDLYMIWDGNDWIVENEHA